MVDLRSAAVKKYWRGGRLENRWSMVDYYCTSGTTSLPPPTRLKFEMSSRTGPCSRTCSQNQSKLNLFGNMFAESDGGTNR